jgi:hypothetical protein
MHPLLSGTRKVAAEFKPIYRRKLRRVFTRVGYLPSNRVLSTRLQVQRWKHWRAFLSFGVWPKSKPPAPRAVVNSE